MPSRTNIPQRLRSLRISRVVRNRVKEGVRVKYDVDPPGTPANQATLRREIPEEVVLVRWRRRSRPGRTYSGTRLPPGIWRTLPTILVPDIASWRHHSVADIEQAIAKARVTPQADERSGRPPAVPHAAAVHALITVLGTSNLTQLVERHADEARHANPGVPDLFLYVVRDNGRSESPRFVEVKKPEEKLYEHQADEIAFMTTLGLDARVLRLLEADTRRTRRPASNTRAS